MYFRASGGLARLAGASAAAARCWDNSIDCAASASRTEDTKEARASASPLPSSAAADSTEVGGGGGVVVSGDGGNGEDPRTAADARLEEDRATFAAMLRAVSAALVGGERLAQVEVSKSGLLGAPCARAMRAALDRVRGDEAAVAEGTVGAAGAASGAAAAAAGAAALLLSRVVDDVSVRGHVAR